MSLSVIVVIASGICLALLVALQTWDKCRFQRVQRLGDFALARIGAWFAAAGIVAAVSAGNMVWFLAVAGVAEALILLMSFSVLVPRGEGALFIRDGQVIQHVVASPALPQLAFSYRPCEVRFREFSNEVCVASVEFPFGVTQIYAILTTPFMLGPVANARGAVQRIMSEAAREEAQWAEGASPASLASSNVQTRLQVLRLVLSGRIAFSLLDHGFPPKCSVMVALRSTLDVRAAENAGVVIPERSLIAIQRFAMEPEPTEAL